MKRPLIFILLFFILGILIGQVSNSFIKVTLLVLIFFIAYFFNKIYKIRTLNILAFVSIFSFTLTLFITFPKSKTLEEVYSNNSLVKVTGVVKNITSSLKTTEKVIIKTKTFQVNGQTFNESVNLLVYIYSNNKIYLGEEIYLTGYLSKANTNTNPISYNEQKSFYIQNIDYKIYPINYEVTGIKNKTLYKISRAKEDLAKLYYKILPNSEASILNGIILGNREHIEEEILSLYRNAGIYHILAISGLHITILVSFLSKIFDKIHPRYGKVIVILIISFYCIFTGASISTVRATIMSIIYLIGFIIYKRYDFISSVFISMLILLIINPMYLFDIGFLYSFTAVLSIAFLGLKLTEIKNFPAYVKPFIISFFVAIGIKPITMYNFYNINIIDIFLNILVIPFMAIVVGIGFISLLISLINIKIATFVVGFVYYILRFFTYICLVLDRMEFTNIAISKPSILILILYYLTLGTVAFCLYDKHLIRKRKKFIKASILTFFTIFILGNIIPKPLEITMLSTYKGEAIVGKYNNFSFLIDSGDSNPKSKYNISESVIMPFLNSKGINKLDAIFVTNCSENYITGVIEILDLIDVDKIFIPYSSYNDENFHKLFEKAYNNQIKVYKLKNGDQINIKDLSFQVLYPYEEAYPHYENTLTFKLNFSGKSILFSSENQEYIENNDNYVDILKVSNKNILTNYELIKNLNSYYIISSLNLDNLDLKYDKSINIFTTHRDGSINIKIYKDGKIVCKTYK